MQDLEIRPGHVILIIKSGYLHRPTLISQHTIWKAHTINMEIEPIPYSLDGQQGVPITFPNHWR